jgi:hypothetical protein
MSNKAVPLQKSHGGDSNRKLLQNIVADDKKSKFIL